MLSNSCKKCILIPLKKQLRRRHDTDLTPARRILGRLRLSSARQFNPRRYAPLRAAPQLHLPKFESFAIPSLIHEIAYPFAAPATIA